VEDNSFSCSWADFDNDGFLDLFIANGSDSDDTPNLLFRNNGNGNHWVKFRLAGTVSNRAAIGAKVRVRARIRGNDVWQMREITGGDGYGATRPLEAHFGLGDATRVDQVTIEWPSGIVQELSSVAIDQFITITEARGGPRLRAAQNGAELRITLLGEPGASYRIEVTGDLNAWSTLTTVTIANADGTAAFSDNLRADRPTRYYRAVRL